MSGHEKRYRSEEIAPGTNAVRGCCPMLQSKRSFPTSCEQCSPCSGMRRVAFAGETEFANFCINLNTLQAANTNEYKFRERAFALTFTPQATWHLSLPNRCQSGVC